VGHLDILLTAAFRRLTFMRLSGSPAQLNKEASCWRARSKRVLSTAMDKTNAVTIWIMDVHFAIAPALFSRFEINDDTFGNQFFM
jgi:succinylglutamate desuccinylase